jgi:hypothetical protein
MSKGSDGACALAGLSRNRRLLKLEQQRRVVAQTIDSRSLNDVATLDITKRWTGSMAEVIDSRSARPGFTRADRDALTTPFKRPRSRKSAARASRP